MSGFLLHRQLCALLVSTLGLAACAAPSVPQANAPATAMIAASPTPAATATPVATATPAATATATATPTPAFTPTPTLSGAQATAQAQAALPPLDPALAEVLQRILDRTIADGYIPGAMVSVNLPGQQPWTGVSGIASRESGAPMTPDTRMRIASISKVFTAVVILQLVEEGKLNLDEPLATFFPGSVPAAERITVRNLLNHTSGLYDYLEDRSYAGQAYGAPEQVWPPQELVAYAAQFGLAFPPSSPGSWDYSSTNYVLLGMIVEQVTGSTMAQEMRQRIFEPANLESTYFAPYEEIEGERADGYYRDVNQTGVSLTFAFATANLVSTTEDVQRFGQALFNGQLLSPAMLELMYTFESGQGQYNMPHLAYGLGVMRNRLPVGAGRPAEASTVLGHIGGFGGFRSALWHAPEGNITIALGVNQGATDPNTLATQILDAILDYQGR